MPLVLLGDRLLLHSNAVVFAQVKKKTYLPAYPDKDLYKSTNIWILDIRLVDNQNYEAEYETEEEAKEALKQIYALTTNGKSIKT